MQNQDLVFQLILVFIIKMILQLMVRMQLFLLDLIFQILEVKLHMEVSQILILFQLILELAAH